MATMAENVIAVGSETCPLMLEKGMYDSWKTRIILYIQGKENGEMLKDSINNGPYQFKPKITVKDTNGITDIRHPQIIEDLAGQDKLRYDSDIKVVNILLLGLLSYAPIVVQQPPTIQPDSRFITPTFLPIDDPIAILNKNQALGARVVNLVRNAGANQPRVVRCSNCNGEGHIAKQCTTKKWVKYSEWFKEKMLLAQPQEAGVADHVDAYDSDCDEEASANAIFMLNLSPVGSINDDIIEPSYDSDILSKVPHYDNYHDPDMLNANIQELGYIENIVSNNESYNELTRRYGVSVPALHQISRRIQVQYAVSRRPQYVCITRNSTKGRFTPFENPEQEFCSSRKLFKTPGLDESSSPEFDQFSNLEENSEEEVVETMAGTMEQYMSKTLADYGLLGLKSMTKITLN
ncbi:integrase, catalytic region, zinc finger, CCHC-type containing protein [Tanacetum coccineum]